jgi:hypothetical protein
LSLDDAVAAELFARLREGAVGDEPLAVAEAQRGGRRGRMQRRAVDQLLAGEQLLHVGAARLHLLVLLFGSQRGPGFLVEIGEDHVFHGSITSTAGSNGAHEDRHAPRDFLIIGRG